jgi:hypothetical protein
MILRNYEFRYVGDAQPERLADGSIRQITPQDRYSKKEAVQLHRYGAGPFCKFGFAALPKCPGVYAWCVDDEVKYVGLCENFAARINPQYGNISPKNCYQGGRQTNCRINNAILLSMLSGKKISLWFYRTADYVLIEAELRAHQRPSWN